MSLPLHDNQRAATGSTLLSRKELVLAGASLAVGEMLRLAFPSHAFADKLDEEIAAKRAQNDQLATQIAQLQLDIERILDQMHTAEEEQEAAHAEQTSAEAAMVQAQDEIEQNTARIATLQEDLKAQMLLRYKSDRMGIYDVVLGSTTFGEFVNSWNMVDRFNDASSNSIAQVKKLREENELRKANVEEQRLRAKEKAEEAEARAADQRRLQAEAQASVAKLEQLQASISVEVQQLVEQKQEIALEIARAQAAAGDTVTIIGNPHDLEPCPEVVPYAQSKLGARYVYGDKGPDTFDCSGLTQWIYKQIGINIPPGPIGQYKHALKVGAVMPIAHSQPGDVLMRPGHAAVVTEAGGTQFIHAPGTGGYVEYSRATRKKGFLCALRFPRP